MQTGSFFLFFLLVIAGAMVLCGTALQWSVEDDLLKGQPDEVLHLWRYSQLLFWFAWAAAFADYIYPNATMTAMQAALIFVIIAQRKGDGLVSFESIDTCRILAEDGGPAPKSAYQRCAAGGVLAYFGLILGWIVSLPKLHFVNLQAGETAGLVLSSVCCLVGAIVLWTSDGIEMDSGIREPLFDTAMYGIFSIIFGFSAFLSDAVAVLAPIAFYLTYVAASQFAVMFFVLASSIGSGLDKDSLWAGYSLVWLGTVGMLLMVASRLLYAGVNDGMVHDDNAAGYERHPKPPTKNKTELNPQHGHI